MTNPSQGDSGGGGGYTAPTSIPASSSSSTGYTFNPDDPYTLGVLAKQPILLGTQTIAATGPGHQRIRATDAPTFPIGAPATPRFGEHSGGGDDGRLVSTPGTAAHDVGVVKSGTDYVKLFLTLYETNRPEFDALRQQLWAAGYYGTTAATRVTGRAAGSWDVDAIRSAIQDYSTYTQSTGTTGSITFPEFISNGAAGGGTPATPGPTVTLADPAALAQTLQGVARGQLGHELTDAQLAAFVSAFHSQQTAQQSSPTGSTTVTPDAGADATQFIQQNYGTQQGQHEAQGYLNAALNLFLPSSSSRANLNTDPNASA